MTDQEGEMRRLKERLQRETRARLEAERLLEQKSSELFDAMTRLEAEIEQAHGLRAAFIAAQDGLAVADSNGCFVFMNHAHEAMFGYAPGELIGKPWGTLYGPAELDRFSADILPEFSREGRWRGEATGRSKAGEDVHQEIVLTSLYDGGLVCATRDISERKARERAARALRDYIRDTERDAALLTLSSSIAHDFNNLLFAIEGHLKLLSLQVPAGGEAAKLIERMADTTHSASDIIEFLKRFRVADFGNLTGVDLAALVRQDVDIADPLRPELTTLQVSMPERALVSTNETMLSRCLINLLKNAYEASPVGGDVTVRVVDTPSAPFHPDAGVRRLGTITRPAAWHIEVEDVGHGIPPEALEHVFQPFFSTKLGENGTGLGLSSLVLLVETFPAQAKVESYPGRGTRFTLSFPGADIESPRRPPVSLSSTWRILLVDDEPVIGEIIRHALEQLGHQVILRSVADDACADLSDPNLPLDLLMTDLNMPGMRGEQLARHAAAVRPDIVCIGFSGQADFIQPDPVFSVLLRKPMDVDDLDDAIHSAMTRAQAPDADGPPPGAET